MSYNYDKRWVEQQSDLLQQLLDAARTSSEVVYQYETPRDLETDRLHIRSVIASASFNFSHLAPDLAKLRTWKDIDRVTGTLYLHVGTENNYQAKSRTLKSTGGRMIQTGKLRGSKPQMTDAPAVQYRQPTQVASNPEAPETPEMPTTYEYPESLGDSDDLLSTMHVMGRICRMTRYSRVLIPRADVTIDAFKLVCADPIVAREFNVIMADPNPNDPKMLARLELNYQSTFDERIRP